jgi:hypothetical protein
MQEEEEEEERNKKPGTKGIMNTQKNRNNNTESFISKAFRLNVTLITYHANDDDDKSKNSKS